MSRELSPEESAYVALADEMNDPSARKWVEEEGGFYAVFDKKYQERGKKWAQEHGLSWPPETGDFDEWYATEIRKAHL